jgi:hypothetical protein
MSNGGKLSLPHVGQPIQVLEPDKGQEISEIGQFKLERENRAELARANPIARHRPIASDGRHGRAE